MSNTKRMGIYNHDKFLGEIGERIGVKDELGTNKRGVRVGDVISFLYEGHSYHTGTGVILNNEGNHYILGYGDLDFYSDAKVIINCGDLTEEILQLLTLANQELSNMDLILSIREIDNEPEEMALEDIKKELGRKIKIVGEKQKSLQEKFLDNHLSKKERKSAKEFFNERMEDYWSAEADKIFKQ